MPWGKNENEREGRNLGAVGELMEEVAAGVSNGVGGVVCMAVRRVERGGARWARVHVILILPTVGRIEKTCYRRVVGLWGNWMEEIAAGLSNWDGGGVCMAMRLVQTRGGRYKELWGANPFFPAPGKNEIRWYRPVVGLWAKYVEEAAHHVSAEVDGPEVRVPGAWL